MNWVFFQIKENAFLSPPPPPPPPPPIPNSDFNLNNKVSPSILLIFIILSIIFFVSGLLHLLVRFLLLRPQNRDHPDDFENVTALQGQLRQLFNLHDCGVDQSFIDNLPVFNYNSIVGVKNTFDCVFCLCEFEAEDKLRLLPNCSHAFHMVCIDTWLLSHSTCPLCRDCLVPDNNNNSFSQVVLVLESGNESSREIGGERGNSHVGFDAFGSARVDFSNKSCEIEEKSGLNQEKNVGSEEKVVIVKLGKFRNVDDNGEGSSTSSSNNCTKNVDERRCFSMGSFEYVMDENSNLQVPIRTPVKKQSSKKAILPLTPGHRPAISECEFDSRREFNGFEPFKGGADNGGAIGKSKRESFSLSKIWTRGEKNGPNSTSRRAFSSRFPMHRSVVAEDDLKHNNGGSGTRRAISEIDMGSFENGFEIEANQQSFARRTLLWLVGRQNKVVHSHLSFSTNV